MRDPLRVVERQPVGDTGAAVVSDDGEAAVPKPAHDLDLVSCERPLRVRRVVAV